MYNVWVLVFFYMHLLKFYVSLMKFVMENNGSSDDALELRLCQSLQLHVHVFWRCQLMCLNIALLEKNIGKQAI